MRFVFYMLFEDKRSLQPRKIREISLYFQKGQATHLGYQILTINHSTTSRNGKNINTQKQIITVSI